MKGKIPRKLFILQTEKMPYLMSAWDDTDKQLEHWKEQEKDTYGYGILGAYVVTVEKEWHKFD